MSIDSQRNEMSRLSSAWQNVTVVGTFEESRSARTPGRPIFSEMLKRIEQGEADGIIAWHPDRLARNSIDGGQIIYLLDRKLLKDLKFASFTFENNSQGKFMLSIIFGYSKYYVDNLSENVRRGNRTKVEYGWRPGVAPLGYINDKENRTIVPDPDRFPLLRRMWSIMLAGSAGVHDIWDTAIHDWGLRTLKRKRSGGKPPALSAIYKMFTNPFYAGIIQWEGRTHAGKHTPLITMDEFDRVQELLGRTGRPRRKRHVFPFTGMMRCGECGFSVTAEHRRNRYGYLYTYYHCSKRRPHFRCSQHYVSEENIERQILAFLQKLTIPNRIHVWLLSKLEQASVASQEDSKRQCESNIKTKTDIEKQLTNLTQLRVRDVITDEEYLRERKALAYEHLRLSQAVNGKTSTESWFEPSRLLISFRNRAIFCFKRRDPTINRLILETIGLNLVLKDRKLNIQAKKPFLKLNKARSIPDLCGYVEEVRTFFEAKTKESSSLALQLRRFDELAGEFPSLN